MSLCDGLGILSADFAAGIEIRRVDLNDHSRYETVDQLLRELPYHLGMGVRGQNDLLACQADCIEGMEEFLLRRRLAG